MHRIKRKTVLKVLAILAVVLPILCVALYFFIDMFRRQGGGHV